MNTMERKKKVKLCADIAMASAKTTPTSWSNALISNARKCEQGTVLVDKLIGPESQLKLQKVSNNMISFHKRVQCKKILKRSCNAAKKTKRVGDSRLNVASIIAKRLVKKRTKVLKRLVPGGESVDEFSLIKEALDYILSLKVQVDVMRSVVNATVVLNGDKVMKSVK
ncbi:transcription factor IBH1-like protein 1 [Tanacetum coccineum]